MANEITVSITVSVAKVFAAISKQVANKQFDMTGAIVHRIVQTIAATEEALDQGDVGTPGYCLAINLDPTNFVSIRAGTGLGNMILLEADGGMAFFKFGSGATTPFAIADTAPCNIEMFLMEA